MDRLVYLLFGPAGCVLGMVAWMAVMAVRRRRPAGNPNPAPIDAGPAPDAEPARKPAQQAEAHDG